MNNGKMNAGQWVHTCWPVFYCGTGPLIHYLRHINPYTQYAQTPVAGYMPFVNISTRFFTNPPNTRPVPGLSPGYPVHSAL